MLIAGLIQETLNVGCLSDGVYIFVGAITQTVSASIILLVSQLNNGHVPKIAVCCLCLGERRVPQTSSGTKTKFWKKTLSSTAKPRKRRNLWNNWWTVDVTLLHWCTPAQHETYSRNTPVGTWYFKHDRKAPQYYLLVFGIIGTLPLSR